MYYAGVMDSVVDSMKQNPELSWKSQKGEEGFVNKVEATGASKRMSGSMQPERAALLGAVQDPSHQGRRLWVYQNIARQSFADPQVQARNVLTYHRWALSGEEEDDTAGLFVDEALLKRALQQIQEEEFPQQPRRFRNHQGALDVQAFGLTRRRRIRMQSLQGSRTPKAPMAAYGSSPRAGSSMKASTRL